MKVLVMCNPQGNQRALAHKLGRVVDLAGIVSITGAGAPGGKTETKRERAVRFARRGAGFVAGFPLRQAWLAMLRHYDATYPGLPDVPLLEAPDVNAPQVIALVERERPDLVVVSGTNLLKAPLIDQASRFGRILNLHTGISPYVKGGPNCTNWCLAIRRFDLIGNTVMWLDAGIDSGNLVATERTPLTGSESLDELHVRVMDHAHDLYLRCIRAHREGAQLPNLPQREIGEGRLFLTRHWTPAQAARAVTNFYLHYRRALAAATRPPLLLVSPSAGLVRS